MDSIQPDPPRRKAFVFISKEESLEVYSCGNGGFFQSESSRDLDVCFALSKTGGCLDISIFEDGLLQWLRAIPSLRYMLHGWISMELLLPRYPELSAKFDQDKREGHSFGALDLFVCHFLREGSVFATGFQHLYEQGILTDVHFHDLQRQSRNISEDLDFLDEAIDELDEPDIHGSSQPFRSMNEPMNEPFRSELKAAIARRDLPAAEEVLARDPGFIDVYTLRLAILHYERAIFSLLLERGAELKEVNAIAAYYAAEAGHKEVVQLILNYDAADEEGGDTRVRETSLTGAISGGHLEIVRYLVEEEGADVNGYEHPTPLSRAIKHCHTHIINYLLCALLSAGPHLLQEDCFALLAQLGGSKQLEVADTFERFVAFMDNDARDLWLSTAVSKGHLATVRSLVAADADINPDTRHCDAVETSFRRTWKLTPLLERAVSNGHLEIIGFLFATGADIKPYTGPWTEDCNVLTRTGKHSLHLEANAFETCVGVVESLRRGVAFEMVTSSRETEIEMVCRFSETKELEITPSSTAQRSSFKGHDKDEAPQELTIHVTMPKAWQTAARLATGHEKPCPGGAAIHPRERGTKRTTMARRLLAEVARSSRKLADAGTRLNASRELRAFAGWVGSSSSVWKSGTRAIRDLCEGYMPRSLPEIVSALQVANAMRSVVPHSSLVCSEREFIDDISRWASLLSLADRCLLSEIVWCLWGISPSRTASETLDSSLAVLMALQYLVSHLLKTYDQSPGIPPGCYRLQTLRQLHLSDMHRSPPCTRERLTLAEWQPLPTQAVQESLHTYAPEPPEPKEQHLSLLARITVLMAGAIFGAILLYLCLSRYGFSTLRLPILTSDPGEGSASHRIATRNYVLLATYVGFTTSVDFESLKSTDYLVPEVSPLSPVLPGSPPAERVRQRMEAVEPFFEGAQFPMNEPASVVDTNMEPSLADSSPTVSSFMTSSSPSSTTTATRGLATTGISTGGTICCEHCNSRFRLGRNGRRGQASNLRKHMKIHHPETIPGYHREMHVCPDCGVRDPVKSNIEAHKQKHCPMKKGKQPRRHGKWGKAITGAS